MLNRLYYITQFGEHCNRDITALRQGIKYIQRIDIEEPNPNPDDMRYKNKDHLIRVFREDLTDFQLELIYED